MSSRRAVLTSVAVAASLGTLACGDKSVDSTGPDYKGGPAPTGLTCSFNTMKNDVNTYFVLAQRSPVQTLVSSMKTAYGRAGSQSATDLGFDILEAIAVQHHTVGLSDGTQPAGTPADGSRLANDVIACMSTINPLPTVAVDFAKLGTDGSYNGALSTKGAFEVRGAAGSGNDAVRMVTSDNQGMIKPPAAGFNSWTSGEELLFFASPISTDFLTETKVNVTGYSWNTVPVRHSFNGLGTIGMCVFSADIAKDRIQEVGVDANGGGVARILQDEPTGLSCPTSIAVAPTGIFGRIVNFARTMIMPEAAYAGQQGGGTGGLLGGLSDLGVVHSTGQVLSLSNIVDGRISTSLSTFTVTAKTANGSTFSGMTVTLSVVGNAGSFNVYQTVNSVEYPTPNPTAVTDLNGVAKFDIRIDKAGGYTIGATGSDVGYTNTASPATSNLFHIKR